MNQWRTLVSNVEHSASSHPPASAVRTFPLCLRISTVSVTFSKARLALNTPSATHPSTTLLTRNFDYPFPKAVNSHIGRGQQSDWCYVRTSMKVGHRDEDED